MLGYVGALDTALVWKRALTNSMCLKSRLANVILTSLGWGSAIGLSLMQFSLKPKTIWQRMCRMLLSSCSFYSTMLKLRRSGCGLPQFGKYFRRMKTRWQTSRKDSTKTLRSSCSHASQSARLTPNHASKTWLDGWTNSWSSFATKWGSSSKMSPLLSSSPTNWNYSQSKFTNLGGRLY